MDDDDDNNNYRAEFDEQHSILRLRVTNYEDIIKDNELTEEFLDCLLEGYHEAENSERKKHEKKISWLKRLRGKIRKNKKEYELPVRQIHLYVATQSELKTEHIRQIMIRSIGSESEHSRVVADRWELFEDLAVGADLLIDACAITTGIYRYTVSGELKEGFAGFGYLAVVGMALLILYFIIRAKGEEPCKRKAKYLTHILRTPITIHRTYGPETPSTFYPGSEIS